MDEAQQTRSISQWIDGLKRGEDQAAHRLYQLYFHRLVALARTRMADRSRRVADEQDVAASALQSLFVGMEQGRFEQLNHREDLWKLLVTITLRKTVIHHRKWAADKRGGGQVRGESIFISPGGEEQPVGFDQFSGGDPTPDVLNRIEEEHGHLMDLLQDPVLKQIAGLKFQGYTNQEIAGQLKLTERSIERKLQRIRLLWEPELSLGGG